MDVEDLVKSYFRLGFSNKEILCLLAHFDFILVVFRLYSRNISTFFRVVSTLFSKYYDFNLVILDLFIFLMWH